MVTSFGMKYLNPEVFCSISCKSGVAKTKSSIYFRSASSYLSKQWFEFDDAVNWANDAIIVAITNESKIIKSFMNSMKS